ncbi:OsmC family protein [Brachybacterium saurashtrense]|uniref:Osmotically inducible protein C n=1 Tax=Brachybacterium saurashtrense TaxID=556288 RepID=A0A345YMN8_9MICO|nr:OsmC family protein [Brachybacterium saurashtrense]AXK45190.1 osmotically inducible protein C [Brachybacterium saurashtrense]RRR22056.1 osmotically inducible protein C [Brachybacterium saurashtrense]
MTSLPDDRFPLPENAGPGSVWADRTGHRTLVGRNQRGVEIPIGKGEGEISPGELLKLALIGCAGMSSDVNLSRRLGEDFDMRLWAHGLSDEEQNRYLSIAEEVQLPLEGLTEAEIQTVTKVFGRAVAAGCTVERSVVPGVEVTHRVLGADENSAADAAATEQHGEETSA